MQPSLVHGCWPRWDSLPNRHARTSAVVAVGPSHGPIGQIRPIRPESLFLFFSGQIYPARSHLVFKSLKILNPIKLNVSKNLYAPKEILNHISLHACDFMLQIFTGFCFGEILLV
jgi:hypothetical protein